MTDSDAGFVVVDVWRVKPGKEDETRATLATARRKFIQVPGVVSVDYAVVDGAPDKYLVIFRYEDRASREEFVATDELRSTMARLAELWDLDDVFVMGEVVEFDH
jgi:quinol monooxygenase YgiN